MSEHTESMTDDVLQAVYYAADAVRAHYESWKAGQAYIPKPALRAMGRRYLTLRNRDDLSAAEWYEFGRLYAWFSLLYASFGDVPDTADLAIDFCNLVNHSPTQSPPLENE